LSLADLNGTPKLLIFFVGVGCPYCVEQLKIFHPHAADFAEAGIPIHTISTDPVETLRTTLAAAAGDDSETPAFPFPILADPSFGTFTDYRCFDYYNNKALHGIYLISPDGRILWNNISHEPFLHPEFLLSEAQRLLALWPSQVTETEGE
jgi:peroxiredoxin